MQVGNQIGDQGAGSFAGVLPQCPALSILDLGRNGIGEQGAGRLAEVLVQCPALARLDLRNNGDRHNAIGAVGSAKLRASWLGLASDLLL